MIGILAQRANAESSMAHMFALMDSLNASTTQCDNQAMLTFGDSMLTRRIGAVGYCAERAVRGVGSGKFPIACVVASICRANMATSAPDSPSCRQL
jgi:hypothetical protein